MEEYNLQEIRIEDYNIIKEYYQMRRPETADSNILDLYIWLNCYPTWYFTNDKGLMWVAKSEDGQYYSSIPCCKDEDLKECFLETQKYFNEVLQKKLVMYVVDKAAVDLLQLPEDEYVVVSDRTYADYVYDAEKLRTFSGKKYHKKKNHLNAFKREYEGRYECRVMMAEDADIISEYLDKWHAMRNIEDEYHRDDYELKGIKELIRHSNDMNLDMFGVFIDGKLEAFTLGTYLKREETAYIHVEKANPEIRGLYPFINQQFLIHCFPTAKWVNREDDMGLEGLRKAKMSYNPAFMAKKYNVYEK